MTSYNLGKVSIHIITIIKLTTLQGKEHFELVEFVPNSRHKIIDPLWLQFKLKKKLIIIKHFIPKPFLFEINVSNPKI